MRDAVDLDGDVERFPGDVEVVPAIRSAPPDLPTGLGPSGDAAGSVEVAFRQRLNAAGGVKDGLHDEGSAAAGAPSCQCISEIARAYQPLLDPGDDDLAGGDVCRSP